MLKFSKKEKRYWRRGRHPNRFRHLVLRSVAYVHHATHFPNVLLQIVFSYLEESNFLHQCGDPHFQFRGGPAFTVAYEDRYGRFWIGNDEYKSRIKFCPVCGQKAPNTLVLPDDLDEEHDADRWSAGMIKFSKPCRQN